MTETVDDDRAVQLDSKAIYLYQYDDTGELPVRWREKLRKLLNVKDGGKRKYRFTITTIICDVESTMQGEPSEIETVDDIWVTVWDMGKADGSAHGKPTMPAHFKEFTPPATMTWPPPNATSPTWELVL